MCVAEKNKVIRKSTWHIVTSFRCQLLLFFILFSFFINFDDFVSFTFTCFFFSSFVVVFLIYLYIFLLCFVQFQDNADSLRSFFSMLNSEFYNSTTKHKTSRCNSRELFLYIYLVWVGEHQLSLFRLYSKWFMDHVIVLSKNFHSELCFCFRSSTWSSLSSFLFYIKFVS